MSAIRPEYAALLVVGVVFVAMMLAPSGGHRGHKCTRCAADIPTYHADHGTKLDDIFNPMFNVREATKNILLLEDHLNVPDRRCNDCIRKHMMLVEGFLDEAVNLDTGGHYAYILTGKPHEFKCIERKFAETKDYLGCAQDLRRMRKKFIEASFGVL
jgi:hypothetical protein